MSFQMNQEQFWQAVQLEEATEGEIGAGYTGIHLDRFSDDPVSFRRMKQLQSFLIKEFQQLLMAWELGAGAESAIACGQVILLKRFQNPPLEIQQQLWQILEDSQASLEGRAVESTASVRAILHEVLLQEDWEAIADAAASAIHHQVLIRCPSKSA